jgi:hypothetical protein
MKIPSEHKWSQNNEGDIFGTLHSTKNVTFDDYGKVTLSKKSFSFFNSVVGADFGYLLSAVYYNDEYIFVTHDDIYSGSLTNTAISAISSTPATGLNSDAIVFNSLLHVTTDTQLSTWNASSWTNTRLPVALTADVPHPMTIFESQATYQLAIGNGNKVQTYDTSYNANSTVLILPSTQRVTTISYRNGYLYVGTKHLNGGEAKIYIWNGSGSAAQYEVPVGAEWVFAMTPYRTTVAAITSKGMLGIVSGSDFVKLDALPIYYKPDMRWQGSGGLLTNGKVFNRGIATVGDRIYLNIEGEIAQGFMPEMHSGLWVYDPRVGLYHRSSSSPTIYVKDNALSVTNSVITTTVAHKLKDGDGVQFTSISGLTGVTDDVVYYVKVLSTTTIKLAKSRSMLIEEDYLTINGTATSDTLMYIPNVDFGDTYNTVTSGAILPLVSSDSVENLWASEILWGSRVDDIDGNAVYTANLFCPSYNVGVFETQRIYSPNVNQSWNDFNSYIDGFTVDTEKFILKHRGDTKEETKAMKGVWTATNIFNSDSTRINQDPWEDVKEGDELVIVSGYGRGYSVHVTNVNRDSATVVVITVDEEIGTVGEVFEAFATNYKKEQSHTPDGDDIAGGVDTSSGWVQLKAELRGFEIAVAINDLSNTKDE